MRIECSVVVALLIVVEQMGNRARNFAEEWGGRGMREGGGRKGGRYLDGMEGDVDDGAGTVTYRDGDRQIGR